MELLTRLPDRSFAFRLGRIGLLPLALLLFQPTSATAVTSREFEIKAVFLYNFATFVEWPPDAFKDAQAPLVIGILGNDPFGDYIDEAVRGERVNNRQLVIRRFDRGDDITACQILFISESEAGRLDQILARLKGRSILTVSDVEGFNEMGGMIRLAMEKSKVRLKINLAAARQARLTISSKLLRPAEIVSMRGE